MFFNKPAIALAIENEYIEIVRLLLSLINYKENMIVTHVVSINFYFYFIPNKNILLHLKYIYLISFKISISMIFKFNFFKQNLTL